MVSSSSQAARVESLDGPDEVKQKKEKREKRKRKRQQDEDEGGCGAIRAIGAIRFGSSGLQQRLARAGRTVGVVQEARSTVQGVVSTLVSCSPARGQELGSWSRAHSGGERCAARRSRRQMSPDDVKKQAGRCRTLESRQQERRQGQKQREEKIRNKRKRSRERGGQTGLINKSVVTRES